MFTSFPDATPQSKKGLSPAAEALLAFNDSSARLLLRRGFLERNSFSSVSCLLRRRSR